MSKIRVILFIFILPVFTCVQGQTGSDSKEISLGYPIYSQYLQNGLLINPAYAGSRGALSGFLSYRMQWMGIADAPVFQTISLHAPMKNDKVGPRDNGPVHAVWSYQIKEHLCQLCL